MLDGQVGELVEDQRVFQFDEPILGSPVLISVHSLIPSSSVASKMT
jgi:hypothetical protein